MVQITALGEHIVMALWVSHFENSLLDILQLIQTTVWLWECLFTVWSMTCYFTLKESKNFIPRDVTPGTKTAVWIWVGGFSRQSKAQGFSNMEKNDPGCRRQDVCLVFSF